MAFQPGNTHGVTTRFQPGQSGNPDGRPRGFAAIARKQLEEAAAEGDQTRGEQLVRKLIDLAVGGNVQAIRLVLDREWPAPNRHEIAGAEGEAINIRWENEIQQASEQLREILGGR